MAYLGVIEGFFGKSYSFAQRKDLASFLKHNSYSFYIYAPKEDKDLRTASFAGRRPARLAELADLCAAYRELGLDFGISLSPLNLTSDYKEKKKDFLDYAKLLTDEIGPDLFTLLFDDMHLTSEDVGQEQRRIIEDLAERIGPQVKRIIACPSYYTLDPILDKVFGKRPEHYFEQLLKGLDKGIEMFWTGPKVISVDLTARDLEEACEILGRKPFLWDNYPVNDGKRISNFIYLRPFRGRYSLDALTTGHAANPMLEYNLSKIPLKTLPLIYSGSTPEQVRQAWLTDMRVHLGGAGDAARLCELLCDKGRENLVDDDISYLKQRLSKDNPYEREILGFLDGEYAFDPACLTDTDV